MAKLEKTITINAPVEKVYEYLMDPANLPEIWPSMVEVKNVKNTGGAGSTFNWVYKMAGRTFEGATEIVEAAPCERVVSRSTGGIPNTFDWKYETENGGTKLSVQVEYTVPIPLLGKLAEAFVVKQNEHEMETLFANLKARMEA